MENLENNVNSNDSITISDDIKKYLLEFAKWGKFLSILGFVGIGLMALAALFMLILGSSFGKIPGVAGGPIVMGITYLVYAVLYFFPVYYLFQSSSNMKQGISSDNQNLFTSGFENLKSLYKFWGIFTIVCLGICVLAIPIAVIVIVAAGKF